jgi:leader peptidase (prepilin peptidase)/N-methyltransferase
MMFLPLIFIIPLGLVIGSFLNVCIYRTPRGESVVYPPSHCGSCGERVKSRDLIPVFSYLILGGKCRNCHNKISVQYPIVELLTGALFTLMYFQYGMKFDLLYMGFMMVFVSILVAVTFIDIGHKIIPDIIVLPGIVIGLMANVLGDIFHGSNFFIPWYESLIGIFAGGLPLFLVGVVGSWIAKRDAMGGGDVKLMAMVGAFIGWKAVLIALFFGVIIGAVIGVVAKARAGTEGVTEIPFGPALSIGALIAALYGMQILNWYMGLLI